ncbi:MAG TPA: hypothetical protein VF263_13575 [Longimicrobiaceae bacterium]
MRKVLALVALLLAAPAGAAAQESLQPSTPIPTRTPVARVLEAAPVEASLATQPVKAEARETAEARESRDQFAQRGSFWWLVGVIVIAGVLLAVLLD